MPIICIGDISPASGLNVFPCDIWRKPNLSNDKLYNYFTSYQHNYHLQCSLNTKKGGIFFYYLTSSFQNAFENFFNNSIVSTLHSYIQILINHLIGRFMPLNTTCLTRSSFKLKFSSKHLNSARCKKISTLFSGSKVSPFN